MKLSKYFFRFKYFLVLVGGLLFVTGCKNEEQAEVDVEPDLTPPISWMASTQQKIVNTTIAQARVASSGANFGNAVALSEDGLTMAVGVPNDDLDVNGGDVVDGAGAVFIYVYSGGTWQFQQKIVPEGLNARISTSGFGKAVTLFGNTLAVGSPYQGYDENGTNYIAQAGAVFVFTRTGSAWTQQQKIVASGTNARMANDNFGTSLDLYGDTLAVGSPYQAYDENGANPLATAGAVFVFTRTGSTWSLQQKIIATGTNARMADDYFGLDIALYADTLAVGAFGQNYNATGAGNVFNAGAVFVYARVGGIWSLEQKIIATGTSARLADDYFGTSVALYADTLAVGAIYQDYNATGGGFVSSSGAVFVFTRSGGIWSPEQKIVASGVNARLPGDYFGQSLSLYEDSLIVGSYSHDYDSGGSSYISNAGAAFIYTRVAGIWSLQQKIVATGINARSANDSFGNGVALQGEILVVGSPQYDYDENGENYIANAGAVFVNTRLGTVWSQEQKIVDTTVPQARSVSIGAQFGQSVVFSEDGLTMAIGAPNENLDASGANPIADAGAVYVYVYSTGNWQFQQKIVATGTNARLASDSFGHSVALYGDTLAVGSLYQDYDETGANYLNNAGAIFVYTRSAGVWSLEQKIVATGTNARIDSDNFGYNISLYGDTLTTGSRYQAYDESGANYLSSAGAVFVYTRSAGIWSLEQKIVASGVNARLSGDYFGQSLSLYEDSLIVGSYFHDYDSGGSSYISNAGAVFVYTRSAGVWSQEQKIVATGLNARIANDNFGQTVSLYSATLAVGTYGQDYDESGSSYISNAGAVFVYTRSAGIWSQEKKIVSTGLNSRLENDYFGYSISLYNDFLAIGSPYHDYDENGENYISNAGAAFVYTRSGVSWLQQQKIVATGTNARVATDWFGSSVYLYDDTLAVGNPYQDYDDSNTGFATSAGAVYIYK